MCRNNSGNSRQLHEAPHLDDVRVVEVRDRSDHATTRTLLRRSVRKSAGRNNLLVHTVSSGLRSLNPGHIKLAAVEQKKKIVVSTHTISLQEQDALEQAPYFAAFSSWYPSG